MSTAITCCKECGSKDLSWDTHNRIRTDVQQGRLNTSDVTCVFVLGCNECSETLAVVSADTVAASMNANLHRIAELDVALANSEAGLRELRVRIATSTGSKA